jgi:3-phosphoshikimate 1-carboxyvinyltransferase
VKIEPAAALVGHVQVPGDKSISHRAVLLGAIGEGETRVVGFGRSADTMATVAAMRTLGAGVDEVGEDELVVDGVGLRGLEAGTVDCANAGTLMRLLLGVLVAQRGTFELTGDESLSVRPMERIAQPLREMGGHVETTDGHAPVRVEGSDALTAISYELPVASAQVKSAILLAGLNGDGPTTVIEPTPTRDHTEAMLAAAGARVRRRGATITVEPAAALRLGEVLVPGDFSSAAPLIVAAALLPGSELTLHDIGINPRRTGLLAVLERMGAHIAVFNRRHAGRELVADLEVREAPLVATTVTAEEVPSLVDELPLVALAAAHARGTTTVSGAEELRVKESDRVEAVADALRALGGRVRTRPDGWEVTGVPTRLHGGGRVRSVGDHRIAMLGAVAGLSSREPVEIEDADAVAVSFPGFFELLEAVSRR